MGRPPAYIFIVRHGNRLDAADKLWHLSSPTPYDPPLTYGGWTQCRALGQRIADILRENVPTDTSSSSNLYTPSSSAESVASDEQARLKKRRYKIVIHSSPFLRCIQTSIAISSGIASDTLPLESPRALEPLPSLPAQSTNVHGSAPKNNGRKLHKSVMRLDAFLGEWLSPSYFEFITPPPSSVLMVASAKAELLRKEDYSSFVHPANSHTSHHHAHSHSSSQLWGSPRSSTWSRPADGDEPPKDGSPIMSPISRFGGAGADNRPLSSSGSPASPIWRSTSIGGMHPPAVAGYVAPVPHFALSSRAPTPSGYVAHARDACVDLDYQWDSMRAPYDWGDGGEFGEEWTAMHRRFRKGVQRLVDWYSTSDKPTEMVTRTIHFKPRRKKTNKTNPDGTAVDDAEFAIESDEDSDADSDADADADVNDSDYIEESIVILVSHGAGCNAMIGAITKEPVLIDVGLASLSVAARRPGKEELPDSINRDDVDCDSHTSKWSGSVHSGHPGGIVPLDKYYEMKMLANSDHLRSVPTTPTTPRPSAMASVMGSTRGRHSNSLSGTPGSFNLFDNGVAGHRSPSAGSFHGASDLPTRRPSGTATATAKPTFYKRGTGGGSSMPSGAGSRPSGGITIGSGVTTFSPAAPSISIPTARLGRARAPSVGLWSPVSGKDPEEESFALTDGDDGNDSDMEILLSFGPETLTPSLPQTSAPTPAPASAPAAAAASLIPPKKKAPSIKSTGSRYPSSLSITHSANSDDDDDDDNNNNNSNTSSKIGSPMIRAEAETSLDQAVRTGLPKLDIKAATSAVASSTGSASPGLWAHPRVVSINSDELAHENALSKRRWTVTERPS